MISDQNYIDQLELAVKLLMSRLGDSIKFTEDDIVLHRYDTILFSRQETSFGAIHEIRRLSE